MDSISIETGTEELLCTIQDRVAVITLNKPHKKNALGDILTPALRQTLLTVEADDRVGCVMITGAGDAFCSGGDVGGMGGGGSDSKTSISNTSIAKTSIAKTSIAKTRKERIANLVHGQETLTLRIHELEKITVAALPGAAAGAGLSIALACDLRIASDTAFVTTAFRNIGLSGDYGASWFLPRLIGLARAKSLFYRSTRIGADEALSIGLFDEVFAHDSFREDAMTYAREIANGPTAALGRMKKNLNQGQGQGLKDSLALEAQHMIESGSSPEAKEAIAAFLGKRAPEFHKSSGDNS